MTDSDDPRATQPDWPQRTLLFVAIGAVAALVIQQLVAPEPWSASNYPLPAWRAAGAAAVGVGALAFGFGLSRVRIVWTILFALALGLVAGLIVWWNGEPKAWSWAYASLFLAIAIAVPLFQTARDQGGQNFPYPEVHGHAWTNTVLWGACWGFAGLVLLLSHLLVELFALIGIIGPRHILEHNWSNAIIIGAAFGAALGLLRDRDTIVRLLQRVVTTVLSVLAPVLGAALILFIVSLPFTGLNSLWEATKSTTPVLIACVIGALVLANTVIGHGPDDEATSPVLRWSALALGVAILPLAALAAIAMGLRIGQHGMTPDRLWGLVVVAFAVGYGLVYLLDALRARQDWAPLVRRDNIRLAFATMAVALLLATPLTGFNAISARDQVARLRSGKVKLDDFDWAALAFDFGEPGRRALDNLKRAHDPAVAKRAIEIAATDDRWTARETVDQEQRVIAMAPRLRTLQAGSPLPDGLRKAIARNVACEQRGCTIVFLRPGIDAMVIDDGCFAPSTDSTGKAVAMPGCAEPARFRLDKGDWTFVSGRVGDVTLTTPEQAESYRSGRIEVRPVERRQLFVGGQPFGEAFE